MDAFPFTTTEWSAIDEVTDRVLRATLADDEVLKEVYRQELNALLIELRERYGAHPVLLETEADFAPDARERVDLYRLAKNIAIKNHLPTHTIGISLARVLLEDWGDSALAEQELSECKSDVHAFADAQERIEWEDLLAAAKK